MWTVNESSCEMDQLIHWRFTKPGLLSHIETKLNSNKIEILDDKNKLKENKKCLTLTACLVQ